LSRQAALPPGRTARPAPRRPETAFFLGATRWRPPRHHHGRSRGRSPVAQLQPVG
jgi:hypothetical protein